MLKAGGDTYEKENDFIAAGPGIIVQRCCLRANGYGRRPIRDGRRNSVLYDQRGANVRTNFKGNADAGAKRANHANARAGKNTKTGKDNKGNGKAESDQKSNRQTKSDEKAAKQRGFFRNGVYYGYGKEISQSGVQVFGKIQTCHFARQRESAGLFAVQSV